MTLARTLTITLVASAALSAGAFAAAEALAARNPAEIATRELPWDGSETLVVGPPARVRFIQAPGPGKVVVTGPRRSVDGFTATKGVLSDHTLRTGTELDIVVTAPRVLTFSVKGGDRLTIEGFDAERLEIRATGWADIEAKGRAKVVKLALQGDGWANLSGLASEGAEVSVAGGRKAIVAPQRWAKLSGNGEVVLVTRPPSVVSDFAGSGRVFLAVAP